MRTDRSLRMLIGLTLDFTFAWRATPSCILGPNTTAITSCEESEIVGVLK